MESYGFVRKGHLFLLLSSKGDLWYSPPNEMHYRARNSDFLLQLWVEAKPHTLTQLSEDFCAELSYHSLRMLFSGANRVK